MNIKNNHEQKVNPNVKKVLDSIVILKHKEKMMENEANRDKKVNLESIVQKIVQKQSSK